MGGKLLEQIYVKGNPCVIFHKDVFLKQLERAKEQYKRLKNYEEEHPEEMKRFRELAKKYPEDCNRVLKECLDESVL